MATRGPATLLGTLALIVGAAGGCGDGEREAGNTEARLDPEQTAVIRTLERADKAFSRERYERSCSYYTPGAQQRLIEATGAASCLGALALLDYAIERLLSREDLEKLAEQEPEAVEVRGDTATVRYPPPPRSVRDSAGSEETEIDLVKVRSRWLIRSFTGLETGTVV